jgi:TRAP-type C4-dicarboxylate transport system substrate-binding protein
MRKGLPIAAAVAAFACAEAAAEPMELKLGIWTQAQHPVNTQVMVPWINAVNAASKGTIKIVWYPGVTLGDVGTIYDNVKNGVADIGWILPAVVRGKFARTLVVTLPFITDNATSEQVSIAVWRVYAKGLLDAEYDEVKPLAINQVPPAVIHSRSPIAKMDDLKGKRFQTGNPLNAQLLASLGGVPASVMLPEIYQALSRGTIDGTLLPWFGVQPYRVHEVTSHHLDVEFGGGGTLVAINANVLAKLPQDAKAALAAHSGERLSRGVGIAYDRSTAYARGEIAKLPNRTVAKLDAAETARWREKNEPIVQAWPQQVPNGAAVLAAFKEALAAARAAR